MLRSIRARLDTRSLPNLRFLTALCVGTFGIMRAGELTISDQGESFSKHLHVTRAGCRVGSAHAVIHLPSSKTDRAGKDADITLAHMPDNPLCPHCLLRQWLSASDAHASPDDHLFAIQGKPYLKREFSATLRQVIVDLQVDPQRYTPHSMRIGGATLLALSGCSATEIMQMGRWTSTTYALYIRYSASQRAALASKIATAAAIHQSPSGSLPPEHLESWGQQMLRT
jgi:hypothetical protein